jgi:hypothetical protein
LAWHRLIGRPGQDLQGLVCKSLVWKCLRYAALLGPVPFEEDDKDPTIWFLDHSYLENMFRMFKKVNGADWEGGSGESALCHPCHAYSTLPRCCS